MNNKLKNKLEKELRKSDNIKIRVCAGTGCFSSNSKDVFDKFKDLSDNLESNDYNGKKISVNITGCHGFCDEGPLVRIDPVGILYTHVAVDDVDKVFRATLKGNILIDLCFTGADGHTYFREEDIPFYVTQERVTLGNCGEIDPENINDYIERNGYEALKYSIKEMSSEEVCEVVHNSGLRGRGGAGFPTGLKWKFAKKEKSDQKYVIANCDEGDPGTFMDRSLVEGDPHKVIEGLIIAGYAIGSSRGYVYIRAEYPLAVKRIRKAIEEAYEKGFLGDKIFESKFNFNLEIREGAGAFVCGEETALIASIEGKVGKPYPRPPYPAQSGLWGKPTIINNVETLADIPAIILNGADWFRKVGTENNPGTKTFAVTGDVKKTGLVEVPMGITLREIIFDIAGGIEGGKDFKAVQIGGPSGGCLTRKHLDLEIDFDSLQEVGAMMGSGGLVVMDEDNCMVEIARYFIDFCVEESCGKCVPCRVGTKRMMEILERIINGEGNSSDIEVLESLSNQVKFGSLCALGGTSPNPILTTLKHFEDEYRAHIEDNACPAMVCKALISYSIDEENCTGCDQCVKACPTDAISGEVGEKHVIDQSKCNKCGDCFDVCPVNSIIKTTGNSQNKKSQGNSHIE